MSACLVRRPRLARALLPLAVAAAWAAAATTTAHAQGPTASALQYGALTFRESGKEEAEQVLNEQLRCAEVPAATPDDGLVIHLCGPLARAAASTLAQLVLVNGRLYALTYLLPPAARFQDAVAALEQMYGVRGAVATDRTGLHEVSLPVGPHRVRVSEARSTSRGQVRVRLRLEDHGDGTLAAVDRHIRTVARPGVLGPPGPN